MDSEKLESPPLLHMYVAPRLVYAADVELAQLSKDVLIAKESLWSLVISLALATTIGILSSMFLYWSLQPLLINESLFTLGRLLVVATVPSLGVLFSLAFAFRTLAVRPIRLDRSHGTLTYAGRPFGRWEHRPADLLAIQICYGKSLSDGDKGSRPKTLQYQVNFVFRDQPPLRRNVSQQRNTVEIKRVARQLADFLDVPLVNYVGPSGTMDAGDAEIRRLLARDSSNETTREAPSDVR